MNPQKRDTETQRLKSAKMRTKKRIKQKLLSDIGRKNMFEIITGEASKGY